jgi:hypothetical protein
MPAKKSEAISYSVEGQRKKIRSFKMHFFLLKVICLPLSSGSDEKQNTSFRLSCVPEWVRTDRRIVDVTKFIDRIKLPRPVEYNKI